MRAAPATAAAEIRTKKASSWTSELNENDFGVVISVCAVSNAQQSRAELGAQITERTPALFHGADWCRRHRPLMRWIQTMQTYPVSGVGLAGEADVGSAGEMKDR